MLIAITRDVSRSLGACELSYVERTDIDVDLAQRQHDAYRSALMSLGCRVIALSAEHDLPDAVFVEDVALVFDEIAISTRPGAPSRRAEVASVASALESYRTLRSIEAPGTLDGGDILRIGSTIYVGRSARTNAAAMEQLQRIVGPSALGGQGYVVQPVSIRDCLHLKSAVTEVADDVVLINPDWVDRAAFADFRQIEIDRDEPHAANGVRVGGGLIYPANFPRTARRLADAGIAVSSVDVSELQKAEGAATCCSIVFRDSSAQ